uniref:Protein HGH1 homolog n=1 Tax=Albugo laibachii Nc14 TaxID=890382 RepID=F0WV77_9STRA|nr:conserved hypothetical protein [Albugo laibachii Nc14]|eukprot:CCA25316.1 conserved hypothetical protein [Albugo laibachii Nc14]
MTSQDDESFSKSVKELVSFLAHPRAELRKSSTRLLVDLTASENGIQELMHSQTDVLRALCRLFGDMQSIACDALKTAINLTAASPIVCEKAVQADAIGRVLNLIEDVDWSLANLSMMLLANITTITIGVKALIGAEDDDTTPKSIDYREFKLRKLTNRFLETQPEPDGVDAQTGEPIWDDDFQYVAAILANISQIEQGRDFLLRTQKEGVLVKHLLPQMISPNVIRRRGIIHAVRNLCFDTNNHFFLYDQLDIVSSLQYLLIGPEELEMQDREGMHPSVYRLGIKKKREQDSQVRAAAIECLLLLCTTRNGRKDLRKKNVYIVIRNAHLAETDEKISEQIYKLVDLLIRDEEGEEPDWNQVRAKAFTEPLAEPSPKKDEPLAPVSPKKDQPLVPASPKKNAHHASVVKSSDVMKVVKPEPVTDEIIEELIPDDLAAQLADEAAALDVSSDEEDDVCDLDID